MKALGWALGINFLFLILEIAGGLISGSLALLADAGHMLSDVGALFVALIVVRIALRRPSKRRSYGYGRMEVLSGLLNGLSLWLVVGVIFYEAIQRLAAPPEVDVITMLWVAVAGLLANVISAGVLFAHRDADLNMKGAFLHLAADSIGSVGVIGAALALKWGGWYWLDPLVSIFLGVLILWSSWTLVRESLHILLEGTPHGVDLEEVKKELGGISGVADVKDLHIWSIGSERKVLTTHLCTEVGTDVLEVLKTAKRVIHDKYGIEHQTVEVSPWCHTLPH